MKTNKEVCEFIPATNLIPYWAKNWFWGEFSSSAPFSWGDNNRTLITASRFAGHAQEVLMDHYDSDLPMRAQRWINELRDLGETYIDLEN